MKQRRARRAAPFLPILFIVIVAAVLVSVFAWRPKDLSGTNALNQQNANASGNTNATQGENTNTNTAQSVKTTTYRDAEFGFSLKYPETWKTDTNENGEGENRIVNYTFGADGRGVTLIVLPAAMEGLVRESISIVSENEATINGLAAKSITATSAKDGSPLSLIFFSKDDTLFDLNGPADLVASVGSTFQFIKENAY